MAFAAENEELLGFLYMCPIGILKLDASGTVLILNPHAAQLLVPVAASPAIGNFFDVFENLAPELRNMVDGFTGASGHVCENHHVFLGARQQGPRVLAVTLLKVDPGCLMVRLGGEEFVILLPATTLEEAVDLAERLRSRVASDLAVLDDRSVRATISLGCATLAGDDGRLDGRLEAADQALYQAKRRGRDRVEVSSPDPSRADMDRVAVLALSPLIEAC